MKKLALIIASLSTMLLTNPIAHASVIAVVDSGTDIEHPELSHKIWRNAGEKEDGADNDNNGYADDLYGWNFADNNNVLVERNLIGSYSPDVFTFFQYQTKALRGTATPAEISWLKTKVKDENFLKSLESFANHAHGTHVAGISAKNADHASIMSLRLIGAAKSITKSFRDAIQAHAFDAHPQDGWQDQLVQMGLTQLAAQQGKALAAEGAYLAAKNARVANCSFGTNRDAVEASLKQLIEQIIGPITEDQLHAYSTFFLGKVVEEMKKNFVDASKNTLFVIAAGNSGTDNDVIPAAPANVRADNSITVAATLDRTKLAKFSEYGAKTVDIAAPGVGIRSTIPGGGYIQISGTSQATPYVTNIAGQILDINSKLSPAEVKQILMDTVDKKPYLVGKVVSEGIANPDRALHAAKLSLHMPLQDAISKAKLAVASIAEVPGLNSLPGSEAFVLPLPNFLF